MNPNVEEALRTLLLAERDITALNILKREPVVHFSILGFHAQQAVEKSLKAVLFSRCIEFERTHDLVKLAGLLRENNVALPISDDQLRLLNPFAVTYRYDDMEIESFTVETSIEMAVNVFRWAETNVREIAAK